MPEEAAVRPGMVIVAVAVAVGVAEVVVVVVAVVGDIGLLLLLVSLSADLGGFDRLTGLACRPVSLDSRMNCI